MYWNIDVTPEDEAEMIGKIAQKIHKNGLDVVAVLTMESIKPLSYVGAQMGRFLVLPFISILGENIGVSGEKLIQIFEKRENMEKLIKAVEELTREEERRKKAEKAKKRKEKIAETETGEAPKSKGWSRFLPFKSHS